MAKKNFRIELNIRPLQKLRGQTGAKAGAVLRALAFEGEAYIKRSMKDSPSAPGDPPGVDTGALRNSIHAAREAELRWMIGAGTDYAEHLEFGTSKMAARPFMGPSLEHLAKIAPKMFKGFLE